MNKLQLNSVQKMRVILTTLLLIVLIAFAALGNSDKDEKNTDKADLKMAIDEDANAETAKKLDAVKKVNYEIIDNKNVEATLVDMRSVQHEVYGNAIEVRFQVVNKDKKKTLTVRAKDVSVDGKKLDGSTVIMSTDIPKKETGEAILTIMEFEDIKLPAMEKSFEMVLNVFSWDDLDFDQNHKFKVEL